MSTFKGQLKTSSGDILYPQTSIDKVTGFPTTSAGDLIYGGTGGELTTLAAGTNGQILKSSNGTPQWGANIPEKTQGIFYAQVDSTSTSTNFTVTIPELTATEYYDGLTLLLYNGKVTSASGFTINVNGLGAKPSYSNMALGNPVTPTDPTRDTTIFNINYAMLFTYNSTRVSGGCWICYRGYDANTNTIGYQVRTNNSTLKASDKFYRYRLLFTSADGTQWVPANTSTSTNATSARNVNQRPIDPFGAITWYGTTTAIEANANVTAAQLWQQYYGTYTLIGYSFNNTGAAATMTANRPIYIKCTPQSNGSAIIDANTPYVQTLPSTDDGKIYIFLGRAVSATAFEILLNHPVYYHKDGAIRVWTNPQSSGMANPMTALGDMIYGDAGADPIKLSIGTSGQVLTSDGSIPYWATPVDTNTTYTLNVSGTGDNANKVGLVAGGSGSGTTWYTIPYATNAGSANSVAWSNVSGHADGVKTDIGIESSGTTFLRKDGTWATPSGTGMSNPMTTKGDIIVGGTNGDPVRLAGSGTTKFLQSTGGSNGIAISWEDIQGTAIKSGTTGSYATDGQVLTADGDGNALWANVPEEIYIATYGSTTYSQIGLALSLGRAVVAPITVSGVTSIGYLCTFDSTGAVFRMPGNDSIAVATCSASNSTWTATTYPYSATETYQVTYGTTTYTDISTADSAGKLCYVKYQGDVYVVSSVAAEGVIFSCATSSAIKTVYVDNQDTWGNQSYAFAAGTVTSVRVQAGTGLTSSQSTAQTSTLNTTIGIDSGYKLPTTTEWNGVLTNPMTALGDMVYGDAGADPIKLSIGTSGQVLTSNGSTPYWATPATPATIGTLNTTATSAQSTSASESFSGNITLHKVSKTGSYSDLNNKPTIPTVVSTYSSTGTDAVNGTAVAAALATLPTPMQFKGSVGTGGTVTWGNLPAASSSTGFTYKVITDHSTTPICKEGDTIVSNGTEWVVIPSGDEPSGTVTSVAVSNGGGISVSGSPITSSGTITISHADTSSQASVDNSGRTYIQDITLDTYGHVTGLTSATETVTDTTYEFTSGTNGFTVTPYVGGTAQTAIPVTVTPSITNNITGSGTATHFAKFSGANAIEDAEPTVDSNGLHTSKAIFMQDVQSSVSSTVSKLYFGSSPSNYYSYLSSNTSGAFTLASANGNFTFYANTGTYNCLMTNCGSDLGRNDTDGSKAWNNLYTKGGIKVKKSGTSGFWSLTYPQKDGTIATLADNTDTTYTLSGALSSHKFTSTLTAGGSGSGTSTSDFTLAAGSNITLTDDTSNRKITIAATDTNTTYSLTVSGTGDNANKLGLTAGGSGSGTTWVTIPYATTAGSAATASTADVANSVAWANVSGHADGVKTDIGIESSGTTFLRKDGTWATPTAGMSNPMTAKGDIIVGGTDGTPIRLAGSGTTKFLQSTGGSNGITLSWTDIQGTTVKSGTTGSYATSGQMLTADGSGNTSWTTPFTGYTSSNKLSTDYINNVAGWTSNAGTVTSVGITNGGGLSVSGSPITSSGSITLSHADTSSQASVSNSGRTYIQSVTLDDYGHVTALSSATETVTDTNTTYTLNVSGAGDNANKVGLVAGGSGSGTTWYTIPYATSAESAEKDSDGNVIKNTYLKSVSTVKNDLTLLKEGSSPGDSYSLIFQRGTLTDNFNDWRIQDRGGFLYFDQRGSGSTSWSNQAYINTSGTLYATTFSGSGASLTSLNASNISSGTINVARLPSITSAKVSDFTTAARGAISGTSPISYSSSTGAIGIESTGASSGQVLTADGSGGVSWSNVSVTGTIPLSQGGTGIDAGSVQTWYTSTTLHPHFQVTFVNNQWTCVYLGPTEGITDIVSALDSQYVKYALSQVVPVVSGTILVFNGVIVSNALGLHAEQIDILFPDMIAYGGALVNGISGTLTWSSADGLYLSNIAIHTPGAVTYASSIVSAATGLGTSAIGSSTQPVYWTGSAFAATTNSLPSVTSADAGKILTVDSNGNWVAATMAQWTGGNY